MPKEATSIVALVVGTWLTCGLIEIPGVSQVDKGEHTGVALSHTRYLYKRNNRYASRALFFLIGLR